MWDFPTKLWTQARQPDTKDARGRIRKVSGYHIMTIIPELKRFEEMREEELMILSRQMIASDVHLNEACVRLLHPGDILEPDVITLRYRLVGLVPRILDWSHYPWNEVAYDGDDGA